MDVGVILDSILGARINQKSMHKLRRFLDRFRSQGWEPERRKGVGPAECASVGGDMGRVLDQIRFKI